LEPNNTNSDPETWIAFPSRRESHSAIDRNLDRSSFFAIAALTKKKPTRRKILSLGQQQSGDCIDPSASEEHGIEEITSDSKQLTFTLPARSLFSAHEEVISAFSAGQRRLKQRMSMQQRRASIAEAQKERQAHMEILEQHFGRRFLRRALTIVEENNEKFAEEEKKKICQEATPTPGERVIVDAVNTHKSSYDNYYNTNNDQLIKNIHAKTFNESTPTSAAPPPAAATADFIFSFDETVAVDENEDNGYYIDSLYDSSDSFLQHAEFSLGDRSSTTEDLEAVF
jgi:hypothetical protein